MHKGVTSEVKVRHTHGENGHAIRLHPPRPVSIMKLATAMVAMVAMVAGALIVATVVKMCACGCNYNDHSGRDHACGHVDTPATLCSCTCFELTVLPLC